VATVACAALAFSAPSQAAYSSPAIVGANLGSGAVEVGTRRYFYACDLRADGKAIVTDVELSVGPPKSVIVKSGNGTCAFSTRTSSDIVRYRVCTYNTIRLACSKWLDV